MTLKVRGRGRTEDCFCLRMPPRYMYVLFVFPCFFDLCVFPCFFDVVPTPPLA